MIYIVPHLLKLIKLLRKFLFHLQCFLINRYMANSLSDNPISEQYRKLKIDQFPIIELKECNLKRLDYIQQVLVTVHIMILNATCGNLIKQLLCA